MKANGFDGWWDTEKVLFFSNCQAQTPAPCILSAVGGCAPAGLPGHPVTRPLHISHTPTPWHMASYWPPAALFSAIDSAGDSEPSSVFTVSLAFSASDLRTSGDVGLASARAAKVSQTLSRASV